MNACLGPRAVPTERKKVANRPEDGTELPGRKGPDRGRDRTNQGPGATRMRPPISSRRRAVLRWVCSTMVRSVTTARLGLLVLGTALMLMSFAASAEAVVGIPTTSRGVLVMTDPRYGYAREDTFYAERVIETIQTLEDMGYIVQTEPMPSFPTEVDSFLSRLAQFDRLVITAPDIFW